MGVAKIVHGMPAVLEEIAAILVIIEEWWRRHFETQSISIFVIDNP